MPNRKLSKKNEKLLSQVNDLLKEVVDNFGLKFDPDQPRDESGRFASNGGGGGSSETETSGSTDRRSEIVASRPVSLNVDSAVASTRRPLDDKEVKAMTSGNSSASKHIIQNEKGEYVFTPERQALHENYIKEKLANVPANNAEPKLYIMGGGPASGKTRAIESGIVDVPLTSDTTDNVNRIEAVLVNADDAKNAIPEYQDLLAPELRGSEENLGAAGFAHEESSYLAKQVQAAAMAHGANIVLDGTGDSSVESIANKIQGGKDMGYKVYGNYITVDTDKARGFAQSRGERSGRFVPDAVLNNTHRAVSQVFPQITDMFDEVNLIDNNGDTPVLIGSGKAGEGFKINNQELYERFTAKGNEVYDTDSKKAYIKFFKNNNNFKIDSDILNEIYVGIIKGLKKEEMDIKWNDFYSIYYNDLFLEVTQIKSENKALSIPNEHPKFNKVEIDFIKENIQKNNKDVE